jgi:hypothetical protein
VAWLVGTAAIIASDFFREQGRRWPILGMAATSLALAIGLSGIGLYIQFRRPHPASESVEFTAQPNQPAPSQTLTDQPKAAVPETQVLHRHYSGADQERFSELLFAMYDYINDNISPTQLEIHRLSTAPPSEQMFRRLDELRDKLAAARVHLGNLSERNGYYQDEITDVLGNGDPLNADIVAITNYIDLVSAVSPNPKDRAAKLIAPAAKAMHETNVTLGTWISQCLIRIKAKRNALQ